MKPNHSTWINLKHIRAVQNDFRPKLLLLMALACPILFGVATANAANFIKADNTTDLDLTGSWTTAGVPGSGDLAWWDSTFSAGNNSAVIGSVGNQSWAGIMVSNNLNAPFTINADASTALTLGTSGINMSNANQSFTINCPVNQGGNETWFVNAGQSLTLGGTVFGGTATASSTFNLTMTGSGTINFNGNYSEAGNDNNAQTLTINSNTIDINPGTTGSFVTARKVIIGNLAGSTTTVNIQSGTNAFVETNYFVMADSAATVTNEVSVLNINGGLTYIDTISSPFVVGLKGNGTVNVANSTLVVGQASIFTLGSYTSSGLTGANGTLNINSGGTVVISNAVSTQYFALGNGGASSFGNGYLNLFSGGTLVCGRNIIKNNTSSKGYVLFSGGTLTIATNSATFMQGLTAATVSTNGVTINDGGLTPTILQSLLHDPTVTTDGGLTKTGSGTLTLGGTNTYNGPTAVSAGTLAIAPAFGGSPGNYTVASAAALSVKQTFTGDLLGVSSLTLNSGSSISLNETNLSGGVLVNVTNALTPASTVTLNLPNANLVLVAGQYPLIGYGSLAGSGVSGFALGTTPPVTGLTLSLVNDTVHNSIDLLVAPSTTTLTWEGNVSGAWDIGNTPNWQGSVDYSETAGIGPIVDFNDSATGTTVVALNTIVHPTAVNVSNTNLNYTINGSGQIAGSADLIKQGSGSLILATANTITNITSILGGTLQLGDGSANNGSVAGNIADGAALVVANPNPQTMTNVISGGGSLAKSGNGTLTLTPSNSLSGTVTVKAGTLALNPGGTGGIVPVLATVPSISIASGATLTLAGANALGLSNSVALPVVSVAGGGTLSATGTGGHTINGLNLGDSSGSTLSGSGTLIVNNDLTNYSSSAVSIGNLNCNCTNVYLLGGSSTLTVTNNLSFVYPNSVGTVISGDPNSGPGTLTTMGNVNVPGAYVELDYLTWNVNLGTNSMNIVGKFTIGKEPSLPAYMEWNSGNGYSAVNNFFTLADKIGNNNGAYGELDMNGGSLIVSNTTTSGDPARILIGPGGTAVLDVNSNSSLSFIGNCPVQIGGDIKYGGSGSAGTLNVNGGTITFGPQCPVISLAADVGGTVNSVSGAINLNGGVMDTWCSISNGATASEQSTITFNGGTLEAGTNNLLFLQGLTQASVESGGAIINDGGNVIAIGQSLTSGGGNDGGLTKLGAGTLILTNTSTYNGSTTISNGVLEVDGSLPDTAQVTVESGGTLSGIGTLGSAVTVNSGASLIAGTNAPGTNTPATLTINNNLTLDGSLGVTLNKSLAQSNSVISVSGTLVNGGTGTVTVNNFGPGLVVGDSFKLFNQPIINGQNLTVASSDGVTWTNMLASNGTIGVLTVAPPINPLPGTIQAKLSGNQLTLAWPTNAGWILQSQTNSVKTGITGNWINVANSTTITNLNVNINLTNGTVFYRLLNP
jgi:fibronectin-binding autotransporter adhesin